MSTQKLSATSAAMIGAVTRVVDLTLLVVIIIIDLRNTVQPICISKCSCCQRRPSLSDFRPDELRRERPMLKDSRHSSAPCDDILFTLSVFLIIALKMCTSLLIDPLAIAATAAVNEVAHQLPESVLVVTNYSCSSSQ